MSFKGIVSGSLSLKRRDIYEELLTLTLQRFGQPAEGALRWEPPVPFLSSELKNTTVLGPACLQQFAFATQALIERLFNNPNDPPVESEDCLFL